MAVTIGSTGTAGMAVRAGAAVTAATVGTVAMAMTADNEGEGKGRQERRQLFWQRRASATGSNGGSKGW